MMKHSTSMHWRKKENYYTIRLTKCRGCNRISFPGRLRCPYCGSKNVEYVSSKGIGILIDYTVSYFRREGDEESMPRILGLIKLDDGVVVPGEITDVDPNEIKEGMRVEAVLRRLSSDDPYGLIYYGLKFMPILKK